MIVPSQSRWDAAGGRTLRARLHVLSVAKAALCALALNGVVPVCLCARCAWYRGSALGE